MVLPRNTDPGRITEQLRRWPWRWEAFSWEEENEREEENENATGAHRQRRPLLAGFCMHSTLTATFGDCLITAHYKHEVTFCKVVTTGEGYNYYNEASPAPDSFSPISPKCHRSNHLPRLPPGPPRSPFLHPSPRSRRQNTVQGIVPSVACLHQRAFTPFSFETVERLSAGWAFMEGKS